MQKRILSTRIDNVDNDFIVIPKDNNKATYSGKKVFGGLSFLSSCILHFIFWPFGLWSEWFIEYVKCLKDMCRMHFTTRAVFGDLRTI